MNKIRSRLVRQQNAKPEEVKEEQSDDADDKKMTIKISSDPIVTPLYSRERTNTHREEEDFQTIQGKPSSSD